MKPNPVVWFEIYVQDMERARRFYETVFQCTLEPLAPPDGTSGGVRMLAFPMEMERPGAGGMLVVTRGPNTGSEFALEHVITTAGRHPDSDIFLDDVTVSRRHAEIERTAAGAVVVRDVGSLNGTYLNQQRIDGDAPMAHGDELQVGKFKLVYVAGQGS